MHSIAYRQLTSITSATALPTIEGAQAVEVVCTGQAVRWRDDGVDPSASVGNPLAVDTPRLFELPRNDLKFIQASASAVLNLNYLGSAPFSPTHLPSLDLWLDATDLSSMNAPGLAPAVIGSRVARMRDKGQASRYFEEVSGLGPVLKGDGPAARPYLYFTGTEYLKATVAGWLGSASAGDVFIVTRADADIGPTIATMFSSADEATATRYWQLTHRDSVPAVEYYTYDGTTQVRLLGENRVRSACWIILHYASNGSTITLETFDVGNTLSVTSGTNGGQWLAYATNRDNIVVGGRQSNSGITSQYYGGIAEIMVTSAKLTAAEVTKVKNYLKTKYAPCVGQVALLGASYFENKVSTASRVLLRNRPVGLLNLVDQGVSGDTIVQIGTRWDSTVETGGYSHLVLQGGGNDIRVGGVGAGATALAEFVRIVDEALVAGMKVVCLTSPPFGGHAQWTAARQTELDILNSGIRAKVLTDPRLRFIDCYAMYVHPNSYGWRSDYNSGDYLHPSEKGEYVLAEAIVRELANFI